MLPHAFLRPFPMGLVPAAMSPRMSGMPDNLRIHQKFTIIFAGLANEPRNERGLSAVDIGNPSSGPPKVNG
jgi:hypothetical protein